MTNRTERTMTLGVPEQCSGRPVKTRLHAAITGGEDPRKRPRTRILPDIAPNKMTKARGTRTMPR